MTRPSASPARLSLGALAAAALACSFPGDGGGPAPEIILEPTPQKTSTTLAQPTSAALALPPSPEPPPGPAVVYHQPYAIIVASLGPQTATYSAVFPSLHQGALKAVEDYGLVHGFGVNLVTFDDQCDGATSAQRAGEIVADPVIVAVLGPMCDKAAVAALPVFEDHGLVTIAAIATQTDLPTFAPTVFNRVILNDEQLAQKGVTSLYVQDLPSWQLFNTEFEAWGGLLQEEGNNHWAAYAYDAATILLKALDATAVDGPGGSITISRAALAQAVRSTSGHPGVTGPITVEADGDRAP